MAGTDTSSLSSAAFRVPRYLIPLLASLTSLVILTTDVYLPVLPQLGVDLATSDAAAAATVSAVLIGIAVGQVVLGPISDAVGRRPPLLIGVVAYGVLHLAAAAAPTITVLLACRFLVGIATAACLVVTRAIVSDAYPGARSAVGYSTLAAVTAIVPVVAPVTGGLLSHVMSWRGMFLLLSGLAFALAALAWFLLPETLPADRRVARRFTAVTSDLASVARQRRFLAYAIAGAGISGVLFSYISTSSFVLENRFGLTAQAFGIVFAINSVGLFAVSWLTRAIVLRIGPQRILLIGQLVTVTACFVLSCGLALGYLPVVLLGLFLAIASLGMVMPTAMSLGMQAAIGGAGAAAGLLGIVQFTSGAVLSPIAGLGSSGWSMVIVMTASSIVGLVGRILLLRGTEPVRPD